MDVSMTVALHFFGLSLFSYETEGRYSYPIDPENANVF